MLIITVCIAVLLPRVSGGLLTNFTEDDLNSPLNFATRLQEYLNSDGEGWVSPTCGMQLLIYAGSLLSSSNETMWAKQMFDAGAKLPPGLLEGRAADLGSFDECLSVEADYPWTKTIIGKYCIGTIPVDITKQQKVLNRQSFGLVNADTRVATPNNEKGLQLATCFPDGCNADDIQIFYSIFGLGLVYYEELCQTKESPPELDSGSIATISVLGVFLWLVVTSTTYDAVLFYFEKKSLHPLLIAFSALTNGKKLLETTFHPSQITCMHGIRVITTMWVILGHRFSIQTMFPVVNYADVGKFMNDPGSMFLISAPLAVDTFFLMAGLVLAYTHMASSSKGKKFDLVMHYVHRYLRLTPVLAVVIAIHITLMRHMGSGPLWPITVQRELIDGCERYWWKTLLYMQNYFDQEAMCVPQSWYLSVDTQLFFLSPILLIPLLKWPMFTIITTGFLAVGSSVTAFLTCWFLDINFSIVGNNGMDAIANFIRYYYMATQTRAGPWLIGVIAGYVLFMYKRRPTKLVLNKATVITLWSASIAVLCICVFVGHELIFEKHDKLGNAFHVALIRPAWAIALSVIIFVCATGYGGLINSFLSMPLFQVVSKLTYTLYLSHYLVIFLMTAQMRTTPRFSVYNLMYVFWGDFVFTIVVSLFLTLAFESPIVIIENVIFGKTKKK